jgi:two-component sensor histidine kinase
MAVAHWRLENRLPRMSRPVAEPNASALSERLLGFDALLENMTEGFAMCEAIWDGHGRLADYTLLEMNPALLRMLRLGPEAVGTRLSDRPGKWAEWLALCGRVLKTGKPASFELHTRALDVWHEIRVTRVTKDRMAQLFFDITERKRAEARQAALFEELNHRVNNNLALVSSILRMKARESDSDGARDQLLKADARVQSIALVHRALYRGGWNDVVDFSVYLQDLCAGMTDALIQDGRIEVIVEAESIAMPVDTAIPLGMVVNELVTNAVKYAYPPPKAGEISVRFGRAKDGLRLSVRDRGPGLSANRPGRPGGGLGMKLLPSLVAQVNGELVDLGPPGTAFEIKLPAP